MVSGNETMIALHLLTPSAVRISFRTWRVFLLENLDFMSELHFCHARKRRLRPTDLVKQTSDSLYCHKLKVLELNLLFLSCFSLDYM